MAMSLILPFMLCWGEGGGVCSLAFWSTHKQRYSSEMVYESHLIWVLHPK